MNIILTNNIIIFNSYHYSNKSKKLECQEEMYMRACVCRYIYIYIYILNY